MGAVEGNGVGAVVGVAVAVNLFAVGVCVGFPLGDIVGLKDGTVGI